MVPARECEVWIELGIGTWDLGIGPVLRGPGLHHVNIESCCSVPMMVDQETFRYTHPY